MAEPLRMLLDTNAYGLFIESEDSEELIVAVAARKIVVYGFIIIRKELRSISKNKKIGAANYRNRILSFYDKTTKEHSYPLDGRIESTASDYAAAYRGGISDRELLNDFRIVACASVHGLDVLVSEDSHSMRSPLAIEAYNYVNSKKGYRTPAFYSIIDLRKIL